MNAQACSELPVVLVGLLGATFSSALTSLVGASRLLVALATDGLVPGGELLTRVPCADPVVRAPFDARR